MTVVELKKILIEQIAEIDDEVFLSSLKAILDSKLDSRQLTLSEELRLEIMESKKQIGQGLFVEQSELDNQFARWLEEK